VSRTRSAPLRVLTELAALATLAVAAPGARALAQQQPGPPATQKRVLPRWDRPDTEWQITPLLGYKLGSTRTVASAAQSTGLEGGAKIEVPDIHLVGKTNPGLGLHAGGGGALGFTKTTLSTVEGYGAAQSDVRFHRYWGEAGLTLFYKALRIRADIARGLLRYQLDEAPALQAVDAGGDVALRVLRWLDFRLQTRYRHVFEDAFDDPTLAELENGAFTQVSIDKIRLQLEAGPALTYAQESLEHEVSGEGWVRLAYARAELKGLYGYDLAVRARYVVSTSDARLGRYATMRLPREDLYRAPSVTAPEDTLTLSTNASRAYGSASFGYWINWLIFDYSGRDGKKSHTNRDSGIGMFFGYEL
jgi:hypothetical protein